MMSKSSMNDWIIFVLISSSYYFHHLLNFRNTVVVGAPDDSEGSSRTGSVYVYKEKSEDEWVLQGEKIVAEDGDDGDGFGSSVGIDEAARIVIGANVR